MLINKLMMQVFDIMSVTECYCKIGSEFYPGDRRDRMNIN